MISSGKLLSTFVCLLTLLSISAFAQSTRPESTPTQEPAIATSSAGVASEIALLRRSVQTLNASLRDIGEKLLSPNAKDEKENRILRNLDLLTKAEQRAEMLRKQLIELVEKETAIKTRLVQLDEDLRPENIERAVSAIGGTRTFEMRETRRRVLENERKGLDALLSQISMSRTRLQEDVRDADSIVTSSPFSKR